MNIEAPSQIAVLGVPYCVFVTGVAAPPIVTARGGNNVTVTPSGGGFQICVTPTSTSGNLQIRLESGAQVLGVSAIIVAP